MGTKVFAGVGPWTVVGWILDAQRAVACAHRAVARSWIF